MGLLSQLCLLFIFKHQYFLCFINCFSNIMAHIFICECNPLGSLTVGYQKKVPAGRIKPAFFVSNFWFLSIVFYCNVL